MILTKSLKKQHSLLRPISLGKYLEIHLSTVILFCVAIVFNFAKTLLLTYLIVIIHEFAHFFTAKKLGVHIGKFEIMPFGVTMKLNNSTIDSPMDELKIALAGPVSNVVMATISLMLYNYSVINKEIAYYLSALNLCIAIINVFPALPLDGGRMLKAYLTLQGGYIKAYNTTMLVTKISAVVLIIAGAVILFLTKFNFSVLLIGAFLITNTISEQRGKRLVLMREILYSRQKLEQLGAENGGIITVMENAPARKVLKILSYNKYYTINIVDENMYILGSVTETKLIEKLIDKGIRISAKDVL